MAIINDKQVGYPGRIYAGSRASIQAVAGLSGGEVAYATDTHEFAFYNGTQWIWFKDAGGAGDMLKSVYDPDGDGRVSLAADSDKVDGLHASAFALVGHTHEAGTVLSSMSIGLLTNGNPDAPELVFADGDTITIWETL